MRLDLTKQELAVLLHLLADHYNGLGTSHYTNMENNLLRDIQIRIEKTERTTNA